MARACHLPFHARNQRKWSDALGALSSDVGIGLFGYTPLGSVVLFMRGRNPCRIPIQPEVLNMRDRLARIDADLHETAERKLGPEQCAI